MIAVTLPKTKSLLTWEFHTSVSCQVATMDRSNLKDIEKAPEVDGVQCDDATGAVPGSSFEYGDSMYARLQRLAGKLKVEQRGIERVPEDERSDNSYFNIGSMV